ncbi:hypothetical protein AEQU3_02602 [Aequorivita antarctica]|nr:hypothetical protein AEQU3_02602 [Aequorivita antarctica]
MALVWLWYGVSMEEGFWTRHWPLNTESLSSKKHNGAQGFDDNGYI